MKGFNSGKSLELCDFLRLSIGLSLALKLFGFEKVWNFVICHCFMSSIAIGLIKFGTETVWFGEKVCNFVSEKSVGKPVSPIQWNPHEDKAMDVLPPYPMPC